VILVNDRGLTGSAGGGSIAPNVAAIAIASVLLAGALAADNISPIFRSTMLQTAVPDTMRGRLQGLFTVVVTGGPRLGDLFYGTLATLGALWFPPILGGLVIIAILAAVGRWHGGLRSYDALHPTP
jgi:hypothetical protein